MHINVVNILALDLGTKTGWAMLSGSQVTHGTWRLATPKEVKEQKLAGRDRCCDCRFARLLEHISALGHIDVCYFEDVQFSSSTQQTQLWASFRAVVVMLQPKVKIVAVPVGTLKKTATGSGNADKDKMRAALVGVVPAETLAEMDDNAVDAYHLLTLARIDNQA